MTPTGIDFNTFAGVKEYAAMLIRAGAVRPPKQGEQPNEAAVCLAILLGRQLGLTPEMSVQNIMVINQKPTLFGDLPLALARRHPSWIEEGYSVQWEVDGELLDINPPRSAFAKDSTACIVSTLRKGQKQPFRTRFSVQDAKEGTTWEGGGWKPLWNKQTYQAYPQRMLMFRSRGFNLRDNMGDALLGLSIGDLVDGQVETLHEPVDGGEPSTAPLPVGVVDLRSSAPAEPAPGPATAAPAPPPAVEPPPAPSQPQAPPAKQPEVPTQAKPAAKSKPDDSDSSMGLQDTIDDLKDRIGLVRNKTDAGDVRKAIEEAAKFLGEATTKELLDAVDQKLKPAKQSVLPMK